jgi:DNA-binding LacI/PurR family transcriptional regulator
MSKIERQRPSQSKPRRVTILQVAADAGVSFAAVSKVLRNAYGVSDSLRERVNTSIKKLGYTPNTAARGLRGRSFVVGVVFPDMRNPFLADIFAGISTAFERTPYQAVQGIASQSNERDLTQAMIDMQMDGLILVSSSMSAEQLTDMGNRIPLVTIGNRPPVPSSFDTVNNNDEQSGRLVVQHLVKQGANRIAMLSLEHPTAMQMRERGYSSEMEAQGLRANINIVRTEQTPRGIYGGVEKLLESEPRAIFCWCDAVAFEVISHARSLGLRVPEDLAIIGHDNTVYCALDQNSLTSVDQSGEQIGTHAARLLVERFEGRAETEQILLQPRLVARRSSTMARDREQ